MPASVPAPVGGPGLMVRDGDESVVPDGDEPVVPDGDESVVSGR
ncbi:hypothetical protein [Streptomyces sp. NPDC003077]